MVKNNSAICSLAIFIMGCIAIFFPVTQNLLWFFYLSGELLAHGLHLYARYLEINFPTSILLFTPIAILDQLNILSPIVLIKFYLLAVAFGFFGLLTLLLRRSPWQQHAGFFLLTTAFIFFILPQNSYPIHTVIFEREAWAFLGYMIVFVHQQSIASGRKQNFFILLFEVVLASIKPTFLLLSLAVRVNSSRKKALPEFLYVSMISISFLLCCYFFIPQFSRNMVDVLAYYSGSNLPHAWLLLDWRSFYVLSVLVVTVLFPTKLLPPLRTIAGLALASLFLAVLQGKGWASHFYLPLAFATFLLTYTLYDRSYIWFKKATVSQRRLVFVVPLALASIITFYNARKANEQFRKITSIPFPALKKQNSLARAAQPHQKQTLMSLSTSVRYLTPNLVQHHMQTANIHHQLWWLPAFFPFPETMPVRDYINYMKEQPASRELLRALSLRIRQTKPDFILLNDDKQKYGFGVNYADRSKYSRTSFSVLKTLQTDRLFQEEWQNYQLLFENDEIKVFQRKP